MSYVAATQTFCWWILSSNAATTNFSAASIISSPIHHCLRNILSFSRLHQAPILPSIRSYSSSPGLSGVSPGQVRGLGGKREGGLKKAVSAQEKVSCTSAACRPTPPCLLCSPIRFRPHQRAEWVGQDWNSIMMAAQINFHHSVPYY